MMNTLKRTRRQKLIKWVGCSGKTHDGKGEKVIRVGDEMKMEEEETGKKWWQKGGGGEITGKEKKEREAEEKEMEAGKRGGRG